MGSLDPRNLHRDSGHSHTEWLQTIRACADTPANGRLVEDFLASREPLFRRTAAAVCRTYQLDRNRFFDEVLQLARVEAHSIMTQYAEPGSTIDAPRFEQLLNFRTRSATRTYLDSSAGLNPASGMVALKRRRNEIRKTRARLRQELGREPSDTAVEDEARRDVIGRLGEDKARRQGMIPSLDDEQKAAEATSLDDADTANNLAHTSGDDYQMHRVERVQLARLVIAGAQQASPVHGRVAQVMFGRQAADLDDDVDLPTVREISEAAHVSRYTARVQRGAVLEITKQILRDQFGINKA